jgi:hypothetical protein
MESLFKQNGQKIFSDIKGGSSVIFVGHMVSCMFFEGTTKPFFFIYPSGNNGSLQIPAIRRRVTTPAQKTAGRIPYSLPDTAHLCITHAAAG